MDKKQLTITVSLFLFTVFSCVIPCPQYWHQTQLPHETQPINSAIVSKDGRYLATLSNNETIKITNLHSGKTKEYTPNDANDFNTRNLTFYTNKEGTTFLVFTHIHWSADCIKYNARIGYIGYVYFINTQTGEINHIKTNPNITSLFIAEQSNLLICGTNTGSITIHNLNNLASQVTYFYTGEFPANQVALSPDTRYLAAVTRNDFIYVWINRYVCFELYSCLTYIEHIQNIDFSNDNKMLVAQASKITVYSLATQQITIQRVFSGQKIMYAQFIPQSNFIILIMKCKNRPYTKEIILFNIDDQTLSHIAYLPLQHEIISTQITAQHLHVITQEQQPRRKSGVQQTNLFSWPLSALDHLIVKKTKY